MIKYGIIGGLAVMAYFLALYVFGRDFFLNPVAQWIPMLAYVALMYRAAVEHRSQLNGHIDFRTALRTGFVVFLLSNLGYYFFMYGVHLYDKDLLQIETAQQIAYYQKTLEEGLGDPGKAKELREEIAYLEKNGLILDLSTVFLRMSMGAIGGFVIAAAIAYVVKTE